MLQQSRLCGIGTVINFLGQYNIEEFKNEPTDIWQTKLKDGSRIVISQRNAREMGYLK